MNTKTAQGFTLIELVIVIILLSILSIGMTSLFRDTTEAYMTSEVRLGVSSGARMALERTGREIREAMPNSVRVNASMGANCVEFVPIVAATRYTSLPTTSPGTSITVVEQDADVTISGLNATNLYVMVIPLNTNEVYNTAVGHFGQVTSFAKLGGNLTQVTISSTKFNRKSPQDRIFFVRQPVSFCVDGTNYNRYSDYGFNVSQPAIAAMGVGNLILNDVLLVDGGVPVTLFRYDPGALNRSGILVMDVHLAGRKESISLEHEVHVRNFP